VVEWKTDELPIIVEVITPEMFVTLTEHDLLIGFLIIRH
jgi:hypothetical protein